MKKYTEGFGLFVSSLTGILYKVMIFIILAALIYISNKPYSHFHDREFLISNVTSLTIGLVLLFGIYYFLWRKNGILKRFITFIDSNKTSRIIFYTIFLITGIYIGIKYAYITGWDVGTVFGDAYNHSGGDRITGYYYSAYSNNRLIFMLLYSYMKFMRFCGIHSKAVMYTVLVVLQSFVLFGAGQIFKEIIISITNSTKAGIVGFILYELMIGLSPWMLIVYTDVSGAFFPLLILFIYIKFNDKTTLRFILKWIVISAVAIIGYRVKATCIICYIAVLIIEAARLFAPVWDHIVLKKDIDKKSTFAGIGILGNVIALVVVSVISACILKTGVLVLDNAYSRTTNLEIDEEMGMSMWHYAMMGLNVEKHGAFNVDDVEYSMYVSEKNERISANKKEIKRRVKDLGISGVTELYMTKLIINNNDGSFGYGIPEDEFVADDFGNDNRGIMQNVIWPNEKGFKAFITMMHVIWFVVLFLNLMLPIKGMESPTLVIMISLMGIEIFTVLFEACQRYVFVYESFFLLMAVICIHKILSAQKIE